MNYFNRPHLIHFLINIPKGLHQYPTEDQIKREVVETKIMADLYGSGLMYDRGAEDLAPDAVLFKRYWDRRLQDYNGGLNIDTVEVKNIEDAKSKMVTISKTEGFVRFMLTEEQKEVYDYNNA
jgi:hypothetical protein